MNSPACPRNVSPRIVHSPQIGMLVKRLFRELARPRVVVVCEKSCPRIVLSTNWHIRKSSVTVRIDPLRFLAGCRTRRLNQALSVLALSLDFFCVCCAVNYGPFCVVLFCVICVFCLLVVLPRLSVPVQVIDWKDSFPK